MNQLALVFDERFKRCPDCRRVLARCDYGRDATRRDGLQFYCRSCTASRNAATYRRRRERNGKSVRERRRVPPGHKFCPSCEEIKPHADWHRNGAARDGLATYCKPCRKAQSRAGHLKRTFGLTPDDLAQLIERQGGGCAICRTRAPQHVDHDHVSGAVRGVLCGPCNMGLGQFRDDPALLRAAATYLRRHQPAADEALPLSPFEVDLRDYFERHRAG